MHESHPVFTQDGPFHEMVTSFLVATLGTGFVLDKTNPLKLHEVTSVYGGRVTPNLHLANEQLYQKFLSGELQPGPILDHLCRMLISSAFSAVEDRNDRSPEFEFFKHSRHAASHGNHYNFKHSEPKRPAAWRGLVINHNIKGPTNPLHMVQCIGATLEPADVLMLLYDIELRLLSNRDTKHARRREPKAL